MCVMEKGMTALVGAARGVDYHLYRGMAQEIPAVTDEVDIPKEFLGGIYTTAEGHKIPIELLPEYPELIPHHRSKSPDDVVEEVPMPSGKSPNLISTSRFRKFLPGPIRNRHR